MRAKLTLVVVTVGTVLYGWVAYARWINLHGPDLLEKRSRHLVGSNSVDCGQVRIGGDPASSTNCALAANAAGKAFRVRYEIRGIDAEIAIAVVREPNGKVSMLELLRGPMVPGWWGQDLTVKTCPSPLHLWVNPSGRINCFQKESSAPANRSSPQAEAY